ncbi:PIN domain-containing protein [Phenylobacterium aquaticum]|uniref:PIN domain-containing protein n=1 Tax=Phenylobacterium aquaticum TaxID=1763816 RepID=UPI0026EB9B69|nr:PIN domain-containing protein [Phenylobacterium aquaticum]
MSAARAFFDTNILLHLFSADPTKADRCEALLADGGVISVQVLNEFAAVASRKFHAPWADIREALEVFIATLEVAPLTLATHQRALDLAERHRLNLYDAAILAAADLAGCRVIYTEDMHPGLTLASGLTLVDPFIS